MTDYSDTVYVLLDRHMPHLGGDFEMEIGVNRSYTCDPNSRADADGNRGAPEWFANDFTVESVVWCYSPADIRLYKLPDSPGELTDTELETAFELADEQEWEDGV